MRRHHRQTRRVRRCLQQLLHLAVERFLVRVRRLLRHTQPFIINTVNIQILKQDEMGGGASGQQFGLTLILVMETEAASTA